VSYYRKRHLASVMSGVGHIVKVDPHHCQFGDSFRPVCTECDFVGPFVSEPRAYDITEEHQRKSYGAWSAAK